MSEITFIAQFPPPMHGLSKAVETLYESPLKPEFNFKKINITSNKAFISNVFKLLFSTASLYYFTISQTKGGNLRDLIFLQILKYKKGKTLIHLHGGYYRNLLENDLSGFQKKLNYKLIKKVSGAIILGKSLDYIFKGLVDDNSVYTVPNCVDDQFLLNEAAFNNKIYDNVLAPKLKVLYLSNFIETKGYKEVLYLAEKAKAAQAPFEFHFAGKFFDPADEAFFTSFIKEKGIEDYIHYHGVVGGREKVNLLQSCHIFILLTRYPNEGQPISILEAMGNGMVIITTNHAGIPDVVDNGSNGLVIDKDNIDLNVIYNYMNALVANRQSLNAIAGTNYSTALSSYTERQYLNNMRDIFIKLSN